MHSHTLEYYLIGNQVQCLIGGCLMTLRQL